MISGLSPGRCGLRHSGRMTSSPASAPAAAAGVCSGRRRPTIVSQWFREIDSASQFSDAGITVGCIVTGT